jgi:hypothetical protein
MITREAVQALEDAYEKVSNAMVMFGIAVKKFKALDDSPKVVVRRKHRDAPVPKGAQYFARGFYWKINSANQLVRYSNLEWVVSYASMSQITKHPLPSWSGNSPSLEGLGLGDKK